MFEVTKSRRAVLLTLAILSGGGGVSGHASPADSVSCADLQSVTAAPLNRLSRAEYARTVRDLIGPEVADALPALSGLIAGIPDDDRQAGFANLNWSLSANHVGGYLGVANEIGVQVVRQDRLRRQVLPCATDAANLSDKCVYSLLNTFATRAYRRPLESAELADLMRFYKARQKGSQSDALSSLITRVLMSPHFLFKQGVGPARATAQCAQQLDDESFRRSSKLAYGLWGSMPDAALLKAARARELLNDKKLKFQIERMLRDPKAKEWMTAFFRQWLHYDHTVVESYSWGFLGKVGREHLHDDAAAELERFIEAVVWTDRGNYHDLMTSRKVVTNSLSIRRIYGLPDLPTGGAELLPETHAGVLTRVAMLAQGFDDASLVKRGAFVRRQILCDPLSPPDPSQLPPGSLVPPEKDFKQTTRQRWEARTAPLICQGCHRMINPLGFSLEAFDGIGRFRTIEKLPIPGTSPQGYTELPIDTAIVPNIAARMEPVVDGPAALSAFIGQSPKATTCFVNQLTKYVTGRPVDESDLAPMRALSAALMRPGGSIRETLAGVVQLHATKP